MKSKFALPLAILSLLASPALIEAAPLKLHSIFSSHMVLQRDQPITIWGWADAGDKVSVSFAGQNAEATATGDAGRWEVKFPARAASAEPLTLVAATGDEKITMEDIVMGDVWVANGQSNMAFPLSNVSGSDLAIQQSNRPLFRHFRIQTNEQSTMQTDIPVAKVTGGGWEVSSPEVAGGFSAIGYHFGANLQQALQIPIGVITNARGGASIESLVPRRKFAEDPLTKRYEEYVAKREKEFDPRAEALVRWERELDRAKKKNEPEAKWPKKPEAHENLVSWNIPGMSPSDAGACYNGMFGVFKGIKLKGVIFHQGFNNAISSNCRPERYRKLMKLMVEGWREDFEQPDLAVGIIGFCAGGNTQHEDNFESMDEAGGPYIRESQRLGLADVKDPERTAFLPAYDVQVPGLHPKKKQEHGERAARWALSRIYQIKGLYWETASLVKAEPKGDEMILTFDKPVMPDDMGSIPRGFSIAGEDGKFYMGYARYRTKAGQKTYDHAGQYETTIIHVWSPLVPKPVAVRYGWSTSPQGNLKVAGRETCPLPSFRTDRWNYPESEDPEVSAVGKLEGRARVAESLERLNFRRQEESKRGVEIFERLQKLGREP